MTAVPWIFLVLLGIYSLGLVLLPLGIAIFADINLAFRLLFASSSIAMGGLCLKIFGERIRLIVTLHDDRLEFSNALHRQTIRRSDIAGYYFIGIVNDAENWSQYSEIVLKLSNPAEELVGIPIEFSVDEEFRQWFVGLRRIDNWPFYPNAARQSEMTARTGADTTLGASPKQRLDKAEWWNARHIWLLTSLGIAAIWGIFATEAQFRYLAAFLLASPGVAALLLWRWARRHPGLEASANGWKASYLFVACLLAVYFLIIAHYRWTPVLSTTPGWWVVPGLLLAALGHARLRPLAVRAGFSHSRQGIATACLAIILVVQTHAVGLLLNGLLDRAEPELLQAQIVSRESRGRGRSAIRHLFFSITVPGAKGDRLSVEPHFYARAYSHDHLCFYRYPGALGVPWYRRDVPPTRPVWDRVALRMSAASADCARLP